MNVFSQSGLPWLTLLFIALMSSCENSDDDAPPLDPPLATHYAVIFGAGPNWTNGRPISQQEISDHFNYQIELFSRGTLKMAGFLLDQDQGFYLQKVTGVSAIDEIIDQDPAIQNGTFGIVEKEPIALQIEQPLPTPDSTRMPGFIIEYTPGVNWAQGRPIWEQSLEAHQQYVVELFQASTLYRGAQYLERDKAFYLVLAPNRTAVEKIIEEDPAVIRGIFVGNIKSIFINVDRF